MRSFLTSPLLPRTWCSIVEPEAHLDKDLARVIPVEAAEGLTVVKFHAAVGNVQGIQRCRDTLAEVLAHREIEGGVLRQMVSGIGLALKSVAETGAVIHIGRSIRPPRQRDVPADVQRVALIVVERTIARIRIADIGGEVGEAPVDAAGGFGDLIGVGQTNLPAVCDARRTQRQLPAPHFGQVNRNRQTESRPKTVVIEEIAGVGLEVIDVEYPSAIRNGHTELVLFVALAR